jgi:hypothetical protein
MEDTTFMRELNDGEGARIDTRLMPLVKFLNRLSVTTVSSRRDDEMWNIVFTGDPLVMSELLFKHLAPMTSHHDDGVHLELSFDSGLGFSGIVEMRTEYLDDFSSRVGVWLEMLHK